MSENAFNLDQSKILLFGKELRLLLTSKYTQYHEGHENTIHRDQDRNYVLYSLILIYAICKS